MAGVHTEVWTGTVQKIFRDEMAGSHFAGIQDLSGMIATVGGAKVIHFVGMGLDPEVLVDNTTYPIEIVQSDDGDIIVALRKLDTKNTPITADELQGISYDKIGVKSQQHGDVLIGKAISLGNHAIAPSAHTERTPIVLTSGEERPGTGRKRLTPKDIISFKEALDNLKATDGKSIVPRRGRTLVLCSSHVNDLLSLDEAFKDQWAKKSTGEVLDMYGFDIYSEQDMPLYQGTTGDATTMTKKAFGAAASATNDRKASIFYLRRNVAKAETAPQMFHNRSETDPLYRRHIIGFRKYTIYTNLRNEGFGAIVDEKTA